MLYLFNEASPILSLAINKALQEDYELKKEVDMLQRSKRQLENLEKNQVSPSRKTMEAIFNYAKTASGKKQEE